ncbi:unnamed protein product [Prorocentrum cordatum]|uniref:Uncharacterized protein n=1 Tax=Prorocentrum cordatum TaxID=2364126 RepID=A0ABN9Y6D0_9DINO|nr:unnamed protein product [Polarella glacialis]
MVHSEGDLLRAQHRLDVREQRTELESSDRQRLELSAPIKGEWLRKAREDSPHLEIIKVPLSQMIPRPGATACCPPSSGCRSCPRSRRARSAARPGAVSGSRPPPTATSTTARVAGTRTAGPRACPRACTKPSD